MTCISREVGRLENWNIPSRTGPERSSISDFTLDGVSYVDRGIVGDLPSVKIQERSDQEMRRDTLAYLTMLAHAFRGDRRVGRMLHRIAYNLELVGNFHSGTYRLHSK